MLTGIIQPTSGEVVVNGFRPAKGETAFKKSFDVVMGQKSQLWWDLPASDSLLLTKAIYEIPDRQYRDNVAYFTRLFEVESYLSVPVRKLSLGEKELPLLDGAEIMQQSGYAVSVRTPKEHVESCLRQLLNLSDITDIKISDDDVTLLVERVYKGV